MQQVTKKNDDGSTLVHLSFKASEVFTETFSKLVQSYVTTMICQKMSEHEDFTEKFTPADIMLECSEQLQEIVATALSREIMQAFVSIAKDPDNAYENVFGKDDESEHE